MMAAPDFTMNGRGFSQSRIFFPIENEPKIGNSPVEEYNNNSTDGLSCLSLSQKKIEIPTVSK